MSNHPQSHRPARPGRRAAAENARRARNRRVRGGAALAALILAGLAAVTAARQGSTAAGGTGAPAPTGERNAMGMPYVATPGSAAGMATAAGVEVTGANWDLGRVPLNVAVRPSWKLRNTGTTAVTLGEPKAEVVRGCCPGPFTLDSRTLAPGASTTLTFELSMHPGMDGPHDLGVHVPVSSESGNEHLRLGVAGDFR